MTLQNGLIHGGRGYLWTDTMLYDAETGEPLGVAPKAFHGTTWPWAAVLSGTMPADDLYKVPRFIADAWPLGTETLLAAGAAALRSEAAEGRMGRLLFCVPCPVNGARLYFIASDDVGWNEPFVPEELIEFTSSGNGSPLHQRYDKIGFTPARMRRFIDYQIEEPSETVLGRKQRTIGGNVVELEVTAEGVDSRVVRAVEREAA